MKRGFEENVSVPEGVNWQGVATVLHFEGDTLTVQKTYDAQPHLEYVRRMRESQDQHRWGDSRFVAHIPPVEHARFLAIHDKADRQKAMMKWLRENSQFVAFDKYLKR